MKTDLHIHSTYSDGELAPQEVLRRAAAVGLEQISITDHDNLHAYDEIDPSAPPPGLRVVTGVELDVVLVHLGLGIRKVEILGYGIDVRSPRLRARIDEIIEQRRLRGRAIVQNLNKRLGVTIWPEELLRDNVSVMAPRRVVPYLAGGCIADRDEARRLLAEMKDVPAVRKPAAEEAIELIHDAGGRAVLAHPARTELYTAEEALAALRALRDAGLDGYELHYPYERTGRKGPRFDIEDMRREWPDALATGGSDSHLAATIGTLYYDAPPWDSGRQPST